RALAAFEAPHAAAQGLTSSPTQGRAPPVIYTPKSAGPVHGAPMGGGMTLDPRCSQSTLCLPLIRPIGLIPPAAGIRDEVHRRAAPSPPCPGSAAAQSEAWVRLSTAISVSASRCSSRRTSSGSLEDAVRRSRRRG